MTDLELRNVSRTYGERPAVDNVSFTIRKGELFFLLGPSGCGKTTCLRMIAGFETPDAGGIYIGGEEMSAVPAHRRNTGMVFQSYALWPHLSVRENVEYGLRMRGVAKSERRRLALGALDMVRLGERAAERPNNLSGGEQQRVALARALVIGPRVLLLDEPLSNLDAKLRLEMRGEIARIHRETGVTAVYVTHDQSEALSMADKIAVMRAGKIEQIGTPREIYRNPAGRFVADFIGEANFIAGRIEQGMFTSPAGDIDLRGAADGEVTLALRPEAVVLRRPDGNGLAGTVVSRMYLGEVEAYRIALTGITGEWTVKLHNPRTVFEPGEKVTLGFDTEDAMLV